MKYKSDQNVFKVRPDHSAPTSLKSIPKLMAVICIVSHSIQSFPGLAMADSRIVRSATLQSKNHSQQTELLSASAAIQKEEINNAWAVDAGHAAVEPHQFISRAQELGLRPLVDLLRTRHAAEGRIQQMLSRIQDVSASLHDKDAPVSAREAAWSRLVQLFEDDFWPLEIRMTLTDLRLTELLQRSLRQSRPSRSNFETWIRASPQFLSPQEWRRWRSTRRDLSSTHSSIVSSAEAQTEAQILEAWENELTASTRRGRKIKLPSWAKAYSWVRFEDQLVEITSPPNATSAEVFLPDRRGRMELLSSRFESFAVSGPFLSTLPSTYAPKLWWAKPCLFVDRADFSVRDQLPGSLANYLEFGEIWPVGEQRQWPRCDSLNLGESAIQAAAPKAEPSRLAPEPQTWSGHDFSEASQLQSASRSWLWVGLAVLAGGLYWHQQSRSTSATEPRPTHKDGF